MARVTDVPAPTTGVTPAEMVARLEAQARIVLGAPAGSGTRVFEVRRIPGTGGVTVRFEARRRGSFRLTVEGSTIVLSHRDRTATVDLAPLTVRAEYGGDDLVLVVEKAVAGAASAPGPATAVREAFLRRGYGAVERLSREVAEDSLARAVAETADTSVLVEALQAPGAIDPAAGGALDGARLRGVAMRERLIEEAGGVLGVGEVAKVLRISRQGVDKRRREGRLLAVPRGGTVWSYPAAQFGEGRTVAGLEKVLATIGDRDPWTRLAFFVNANDLLDGDRPVDALAAGRLDAVLAAAEALGEQGAA